MKITIIMLLLSGTILVSTNCGGNFDPGKASTSLPGRITSGNSLNNPLLYPRVNAFALAKNGYQTISSTERVDRYSVTFSQDMNPATITSSNIYFRDICDGNKINAISATAVTSCVNTSVPAQVPSTVTYDASARKAYIDVTVDPAGAVANTTALSLDELVVSSNVQNISGYGLMGNRACSSSPHAFCSPNDYRRILPGTNWQIDNSTSTAALPVRTTIGTAPMQLFPTASMAAIGSVATCYIPGNITLTLASNLAIGVPYPALPLVTVTGTYSGVDLDNTLALDTVMPSGTISVTDGATTSVNVTSVDIVNPAPAAGSTALTGSFDGFSFVVSFIPLQETEYNISFTIPTVTSLCQYPDGTAMRNTVIEDTFTTISPRDGSTDTDLATWYFAPHDIATYTSVTPGVASKYAPAPTSLVYLGTNARELQFPETMNWNTLTTANIKAYTTDVVTGLSDILTITIMNPDTSIPLIAPVAAVASPTRAVITSTDYRPINGIIVTNGVQSDNGNPMDPNNDGTTLLNPVKMTLTGQMEDYFYWGTTPLVP